MGKESIVGTAMILFGIIVGGAGIATAGIGIGIPIIPLGCYLVWRGYQRKKAPSQNREAFSIEKTPKGKIGVGILLILTGIATSTLLIGIPIMIFGAYLVIQAFRKPKKYPQ